jgi:hypothetical protein
MGANKKGNAVKAAPSTSAKRHDRTAQGRRSLFGNGLVLLLSFKGFRPRLAVWKEAVLTPMASVKLSPVFYPILFRLEIGATTGPPLLPTSIILGAIRWRPSRIFLVVDDKWYWMPNWKRKARTTGGVKGIIGDQQFVCTPPEAQARATFSIPGSSTMTSLS